MYKSKIKSELVKILARLDIEQAEFIVEKPAEKKHGDYATNIALILAGKLKKSPIEIAKDIVSGIPKLSYIERIEIEHPGFINFHLRREDLITNLDEIIQKAEGYGSFDIGKGKKVVLEHTAVNPNKALHIGHLRSACLGSACEKILEFLGYDVEVEYYVDDTGVQVAISALGAEELGIDPKPGEKYDHYAGRAYVEAMAALKKDKKLESKKEEIVRTLDKQEGEKLFFLQDFVENIIRANLETTKIFNIEYDVLTWESNIILNKFWDKTFKILKLNSNFYQAKSGKNKGCWIFKSVADSRPEPGASQEKVIVKSNGVVTYTGKDIAYHLWKYNLLGKDFKYKKWQTDSQKKSLFTTAQNGKKSNKFGHAELVVNFIDARQSFPQQAVKNALDILGYQKEAKNMKHICYGVVSLSPKTARELGAVVRKDKNQYAMSGREGIVVLADDLLELVQKKLKQKHPDAPEPKKIATAAIKYLMLVYNTYSDIIFSYDKALDVYGNSGPYLQYTYVRCQSVLRKAVEEKKEISFSKNFERLDLSKEEIDILRWLIHFSEAVLDAGKQYAPNLLCNFLFELASRFNTFYNKRPILQSKKGPESTKFRLLLTAATVQVLSNGLGLLGIEKPKKM